MLLEPDELRRELADRKVTYRELARAAKMNPHRLLLYLTAGGDLNVSTLAGVCRALRRMRNAGRMVLNRKNKLHAFVVSRSGSDSEEADRREKKE